jgi:hypothetical protein
VVDTPWGPLPAKQVQRPDGRTSLKPEADALEELSRSSGCSLERIRTEAAQAPFRSEADWI